MLQKILDEVIEGYLSDYLFWEISIKMEMNNISVFELKLIYKIL